MMFEKGNTVRFEVQFKNFDNEPVDPEEIAFKVYDARFNELSNNPIGINNRIRDAEGGPVIGSYYYDHVFNETGNFHIEFIGYINNKPTLKRKKVEVAFNV